MCAMWGEMFYSGGGGHAKRDQQKPAPPHEEHRT